MLQLPAQVHAEMVGHAYDGLPNEACGLLVGSVVSNTAVRFHGTENEARSAKLYTIPPAEHLAIDRAADDDGLAVIGVMHSHTHTDAYPSPTDVAQAPDPTWHYVIVSLRDTHPVLRSFRIEGDVIVEEEISVIGG